MFALVSVMSSALHSVCGLRGGVNVHREASVAACEDFGERPGLLLQGISPRALE